ncbi:MAG: phosphotransferase family protein [Actinomycetota bacterium]
MAATIDDVDARWLSAALGSDIAAVRATRVGTGQIGLTYRLAITWARGGSGPSTLIVKLAAQDETARARVAEGYRKEVGFYTDLAPSLAIRTPRCWYAALADDATTFTLLLDDLAPARPGVQAAACSIAEAQAAVRNLVGLHAPRWNDPTLDEHGFLDRTDADAAGFVGAIHVEATEQFVARYVDRLDDDDIATLRSAAAATAPWFTTRPDPFALVHGDYRLDNLMFAPDGSVAALDWQTVSVGPPARDLAYFLGTCLHVDDRRAHEVAVVEEYHRSLGEAGVRDYDRADALTDYRLGQLQGPLITVLGSEFATATRGPAADEMFLAMARRSCAAIRDLGSLDLVS